MSNHRPNPTTTDAGIPVASDEHSLTVGPDGPLLSLAKRADSRSAAERNLPIFGTSCASTAFGSTTVFHSCAHLL